MACLTLTISPKFWESPGKHPKMCHSAHECLILAWNGISRPRQSNYWTRSARNTRRQSRHGRQANSTLSTRVKNYMDSSSTAASLFHKAEPTSPTWRPSLAALKLTVNSCRIPLEEALPQILYGGRHSSQIQISNAPSQHQPLSSTLLLTQTLAQRLVLGLQLASSGGHGGSSQDGKQNSDSQDIGWAEAAGFFLLAIAILEFYPAGMHYRLYGDNKGVVEGWWKGRSRNIPTNSIFRSIHILSTSTNTVFLTRYVPSAANPANDPSRGRYGPTEHLLPHIPIPGNLRAFIVDFDAPLQPTELRLVHDGQQLLPKPRRSAQQRQDIRKASGNPAETLDEWEEKLLHEYKKQTKNTRGSSLEPA